MKIDFTITNPTTGRTATISYDVDLDGWTADTAFDRIQKLFNEDLPAVLYEWSSVVVNERKSEDVTLHER